MAHSVRGQRRRTYRAIVFFLGPRTLWRTGRAFDPASADQVPVLEEGKEPDPAEVLIERSFRTRLVATAWARAHLRRLRNVRAEIHTAPRP
jgi:hypothetical protein